MPKNKFQDVVLTAIMATIMVYGMVVYHVCCFRRRSRKKAEPLIFP